MAQFASDAFTGTSGTALQTYDSNWVEHGSSSGDDATIESNRAGSRSVGNTTKLYYHQGAPAAADYSVSSDVYCVTNLGSGGICGRINTAANTFYISRCDAAAAGYALYKAVSGTFTQLGSTSSATFSSSTTYQVKLKMVGSTIELFKAGEGTATISVTDTAITAAGKSGFRHNANQTTGFHIDNFSADDIGGSSLPTLTGITLSNITTSGYRATVAGS